MRRAAEAAAPPAAEPEQPAARGAFGQRVDAAPDQAPMNRAQRRAANK
jgi:preprotein translocase subunit SecA